MVWDRWGWRKKYKKKLRDYKRGKESEALFGRTPSRKLLFLANNDSDGIEYQFAGTGLTYNTGKKIAEALDREQRGIGTCASNSECPTGYACIDGTCVKIYTRDGSTWGTCGQDQINFPCKTKKTSDNKCNNSRPGPGDCLNSDCGAGNPKCCRQNPSGSVDCYCGNCEDVEAGLCDPFCDNWFKMFGYRAAGCSLASDTGGGYCGGNICTSCQQCDDREFVDTYKCYNYELGDIGAPCYCVGCEKPCERCDKDNNSPGFADCEFDSNNCQSCCSRSNVECPCGIVIPSISVCTSYDGLTCPNVLDRKITAECDKLCENENEPDPCLPVCTTQTFEIDAADLGTFVPGPCPDGFVCRQSGSMVVGSEATVFYEKCDYTQLPEDCKKVGCNCNDDCADCESCNAEGECEDDPNCQNLTYTVRAKSGGGRTASAQSFGGIGCLGCNQGTVSITTRTITGQLITDVFEWRATSTSLSTWPTGNPCDSCDDGFLAPNQQLTATLYYVFKNGELYTDTNYPSGISYTDQFLTYSSFADGSGYGKQEGNTGTIEYTVEP